MSEEMTGLAVLRAVFTAHLGTTEWPADAFDVDVVAHERSAFAMRKHVPAKAGRYWPALVAEDGKRLTAMAVNVIDANGVEQLTTVRTPASATDSRRLSLLAAKGDELDDAKHWWMGVHKRARLLRPVLLGVAALTAKVEKAAIVEARRKRAKAKAS